MKDSAWPLARRSFLKKVGGSALGGLTWGQCPSLWAEELERSSLPFPSSMMTAARDELDIPLYLLSGTVPLNAEGHAFIAAALPAGDGSPVTNGDGMIYRLDFGKGPSGVSLRSRIAKTPCYYADQAAQGTPLAFRNVGMLRRSDRLGVRNQANTAFTRMGSRLLITFDGGRPYEMDTETLELITPVGRCKEWTTVVGLPASDLIKLVFMPYLSGAHPFYDDYTGELFLANYQPAIPMLPAETLLLRWDGEGELERFRVQVKGSDVRIKQSMHQLAATRDHIILVDTAFAIEFEQILFPSMIRPELWDTSLYLIRRTDLPKGGGTVEARRITIPREIAHFVADYDDSQGKIILNLTHGAAWPVSEWLRRSDKEAQSGRSIRPELEGMLVVASDMTPLARYVLDVESGLVQSAELRYDETLTWSVNLYATHGRTLDRIDEIYWTSVGFHPELLSKRVYDLEASYKYRHVPLDKLPFTTGKPAALFRINTRQLGEQKLDAYCFPRGRAVSSPTFIPAGGQEASSKGYILVTVVSDDKSLARSSGDEIWLFDAQNLARGPLCRLGHPLLSFGYSLHSTWLPAVERRSAAYLVSPREDYAEILSSQSREVVQLFERAVFPHFT